MFGLWLFLMNSARLDLLVLYFSVWLASPGLRFICKGFHMSCRNLMNFTIADNADNAGTTCRSDQCEELNRIMSGDTCCSFPLRCT